jgi:phosphomannomutase
MSIRVGTVGSRATSAGEPSLAHTEAIIWSGSGDRLRATTRLVEREAVATASPIYETFVIFRHIGESDYEYGSVFGGEESSRLVIKGYHPPKDGIVAGLFAAKTLATRRPSLTKQLNARYQRPGEVAAARVGVVLSSAQSMSSPSKVQPNPDIGSCLLKRLNRISGARVQFAGGNSCADDPSGNELLRSKGCGIRINRLLGGVS